MTEVGDELVKWACTFPF